MGWTSASGPNRSAASCSANPASMLAKPSTQTGWRASRKTSHGSKPVAWWPRAPSRWHTEDVAVQKLAATESRIASSMYAQCFRIPAAANRSCAACPPSWRAAAAR